MVTRTESFLAGLALAGAIIALALPAMGQQIASASESEVCASDGQPGSAYSRAHRTYRPGRAGYEHDHVVPLCLGGADTDANLQWQPLAEAREKDRLERFACIQVCRNHAVPLVEAQSWFTGDWRAQLWRVR